RSVASNGPAWAAVRAIASTLPDVQTRSVIEAITGHRVPARYEKFLSASKPHVLRRYFGGGTGGMSTTSHTGVWLLCGFPPDETGWFQMYIAGVVVIFPPSSMTAVM